MALFQNYYHFVSTSSDFQNDFQFQQDTDLLFNIIEEKVELQSEPTNKFCKLEFVATRTKRKRFEPYQTAMLEASYKEEQFIKLPNRKVLSQETNLTEIQIKHWFQNRRAKDRKKQKKEIDHYILNLIQNTSSESFRNLLDYSDNLFYVEPESSQKRCPHEDFHRTNLRCPC